jgi:uncharacterized protein YdaU (DUF1376 family)
MPKHKQFWMKMNMENFRSSAFIVESELAVTGAYINLLAAAWMTEDCTLPSDPNVLKRIAFAESDEVWGRVWPQLRVKFKRRNGRLYNEVQMIEFEKAVNAYSAAVNNGAKGGRPKNPEGNLTLNLTPNPEHNRTKNLEHRTIDKSQKTKAQDAHATAKPKPAKKPKTGSLNPDFQKFWAAYPKKVGRKNAEKSWLKIDKSKTPVDVILRGLELATKSRQWKSDGGKFIPHPTTWLNQDSWLDDHSGLDISETVKDPRMPF